MSSLKTLKRWNKEGADCQAAGLAIDANPHDQDTDAYRCWLAGYITALGFRGGDCVRVKHRSRSGFYAGHAFIANLYSGVPGGAVLDREIGGFRCWNVCELVKIDLSEES